MASAELTTRCCIAGGGPAGLVLGYLLARAGVDVVVLEKHAELISRFRMPWPQRTCWPGP